MTFAVDDVEPATAALSFGPAEPVLRDRLDRPVFHADPGAAELIERYDTARQVGRAKESHPFADAVHLAFSEHRPLVITPDVIWLTIAQGIAQHVNCNAEQLRAKLIDFDSKREINVSRNKGLAELTRADWVEIIDDFTLELEANAQVAALPPMVANFSTTTAASRVASRICLLDTFSRYFDYVVYCICGFPQITLLGTVADWRDIRARVDGLSAIGLGWWSEHLIPICEEFIAAASGDPDRTHWREFYKLADAYGAYEVNGWFAKLFPYLRDDTGSPNVRNPMLVGTATYIFHSQLPNGLTEVPVRVCEPGGRTAVSLVAGFTGVSQDPHTLALMPEIGWVVAGPNDLANAIRRIEAEPAHRMVAREGTLIWESDNSPAGMREFYGAYQRVELFAEDHTRRIRLSAFERDVFGQGPNGEDLSIAEAETIDVGGKFRRWPVLCIRNAAGELRVLADGFPQFLTRCLDEGPFWLAAEFEGAPVPNVDPEARRQYFEKLWAKPQPKTAGSRSTPTGA